MCSLTEIRIVRELRCWSERAGDRLLSRTQGGGRERTPSRRARSRRPATAARHPVCPDFHAAIELIGRRWAGAILWALAERPHYFAELTTSVPGLSDRLLSRRLRELEARRPGRALRPRRHARRGSPTR